MATFLGGLELAEGVSAKVHIAGSNLVEAVYLQTTATTVTKTDALKKGYPFLCNDLKTMHAYEGSATYDKGQFMWQGMFYADEAGTWAFAGSYDDQGDLWIDDVDIGADGAKAAATVVAVNGITPGWHKFKLRVADNAGNWGPWGNAGTCVTVTVNGNAYKFDESAFSFSAVRPAEYAGLDGEVTLNAGSTLTNDQTVDACPIWGTLKGTGTLNGRFAFVGVNNCWAVEGTANRRNLAAATFGNAEGTALAGLKKVKVTFNQKPACGSYIVGPALGVIPQALEIEVKDGAGNEYSEDFVAFVREDQLLLKNKSLDGTILYLR